MEHPLLSTFMLNRSSNFHVGLWKAPNTWYIIETLTSRKSSCSLVCSDDQDVEYFGGTFKISQCSIFWYLLFIYKKNLGLYHSDMLNSNWKCETCVNEWTKLVISSSWLDVYWERFCQEKGWNIWARMLIKVLRNAKVWI